MDERQLNYAVSVAEVGSFTAAAERCHIAQSALSYQIASLERQLGARLFDRTSRSVRLTEAGRLFLPVARRVLGELTDVRAELWDIDGTVRGSLRIGMTQTATRILGLTPVLADYSRKYPDVEFSVVLGPGPEMFRSLRSAELDITLAAIGAHVPVGLQYQRLGRIEPLVAAMASDHSLARHTTVQIHQLAATSRFIDFRSGTTLWTKVHEMAQVAGIERQVMCELGNIIDMVRLAATGVGVAIVPRTFTEPTEGQPNPPEGISAVPLAEPDANLTIGLSCDKARTTTAAIRAFTDLLTEHHLLAAPNDSGQGAASDVPRTVS